MWGRKLTNFEVAPSTVLGELQMKCLCKTVQITIETEPLLGCSQVAPGKSTVELISGDKPTSSSQTKRGAYEMSPATGGTRGEGDLAYQMKPSGSEKARLEARFGSTTNQLSD